MAIRIGPILTVADLEVMPNDGNRYELIEGELLGSHAPILTHQRISGNIFLAISRYIDEHPQPPPASRPRMGTPTRIAWRSIRVGVPIREWPVIGSLG